MALEPGTTLGPYEVLSAIGAVGMGEVYKARDTKLDRDVALKILPDAFVTTQSVWPVSSGKRQCAGLVKGDRRETNHCCAPQSRKIGGRSISSSPDP